MFRNLDPYNSDPTKYILGACAAPNLLVFLDFPFQECRKKMGEAGEDRLESGNSFLFASLEMSMCVLLRRYGFFRKLLHAFKMLCF